MSAQRGDDRRAGQGHFERCEAVFDTEHWGTRRCDLAAGHDGLHTRNDGCGRPEYIWKHDGQRLSWTDS